MTTAFLLCPFCSSSQIEILHCEEDCCGAKPQSILCRCGCELSGNWNNDEDAIAAWNRRYTPPMKFVSSGELGIRRDAGCVSSKFCSQCDVNLCSSCMCGCNQCSKCDGPLTYPQRGEKPNKYVYEWKKDESQPAT